MYEKQADLDWTEPTLQRWMSSISKESTRRGYKTCFRRYAAFTGLSAGQLIDEAIEDSKLDVREKKDIVKTRLLGFYEYLKNAGLGSHYCNTSVQSIRSFYQTFSIGVRLKGRSKLPRVKSKHKRLMITPEILKKLLDNTKSLRDRAILTVLFQSGMDVATLCSLRFCDVAQGLNEDQSPMKIEVQRPKTGTDYYTFVGRDGLEALKIYLNDLKARGFNLKDESPVFLKEGSQTNKFERMTPNLVQFAFRELAKRTGFMTDEDRNVMSPHSFRESFSSILLNNNVPDSIVDFLLGHEIGTMAQAYKKTDYEKVREMYAQTEPKLSLGNGNGNRTKIEELKESIIQIQKDSLAYKTASEILAQKTIEMENRVSLLGEEAHKMEEQKRVEIEGLQKRVAELEQQVKSWKQLSADLEQIRQYFQARKTAE